MEICIERNTIDIRSQYQKANKLRYEIDNNIDSLEINCSQQTIDQLLFKINSQLSEYTNILSSIDNLVIAQSETEQNEWFTKISKLKQYEGRMKTRLNRTRSQIQNHNGNWKHKYKDEDEYVKSEVDKLVKEKEGLEQSRKIALEIQNYGSMVWNSIKDQSNKLRGTFLKSDKINDGMDISNEMANKLFKNDRADFYIFMGLAILTILLIFVCYYYIKPWLFS